MAEGDLIGIVSLGDRFHARLGNNLRKLVCTTGADVCSECIAFDPCPYAALFEDREPARSHRLLRGQQAPSPWVFSLPHGERNLERGQKVELGLIGVGRAWRMLPYLLLALQRMPDRRSRRGRPFWPLAPRRLLQTWRGGKSITIWRAGARSIGSLQPPQPLPLAKRRTRSGELAVRFASPLALKTRGKVLRRAPGMGELVRAAARRVVALGASWSDVELPGDLRGLFEVSDRAEIASAEVQPVRWIRDSRRQKGGVPMEGVVGEARYTGVDPVVVPWLELGILLHLGKGTAFGLGRIAIEG